MFCIRTPVFDHVRIGELASVVGEDDVKQLPEQVGTSRFPEYVEKARAGLR